MGTWLRKCSIEEEEEEAMVKCEYIIWSMLQQMSDM